MLRLRDLAKRHIIDSVGHIRCYGVILSVVLVGVLLLPLGTKEQVTSLTQTASLSNVLAISAPKEANTGERIDIMVGPSSIPDGTPVGLVTVDTHGPTIYHTAFADGIATFTLPTTDTQQPGSMALIVATGNARGVSSILLRKPSSDVLYVVRGLADIG